MKIPFVDLQRQHQPIMADINKAINRVVTSGVYISGKETKEFEEQFARFIGVNYGIGCSSGTSALQLALSACGVKQNDEVITTPMTFIATAEAISAIGAKPVFVDIDEKTYTIDPNKIKQAITNKTKAIIVVHLFGQSADMDPIIKLCKQYNIKIIEDAAQAHGAYYKDKIVGSLGDVGCFSFFPGKNLGAFGDAGMVVCNDAALAKHIKMLRDHGRVEKYKHDIIGFNHRIDEIQAAILTVKLATLVDGNKQRQFIAKFYDQHLSNIGNNLILPFSLTGNTHAYHLYVIRYRQRDELMSHCMQHGINVGIHYPTPLHLQPAYSNLDYKTGSFPIAEEVAKTALSIPIFPGMTEQELLHVSNTIKDFFN